MSFNIDSYISNLSYINKDFNSLWDEIMEVVPKLTSKWNPGEANESDPLVVLLKELGIVSDKLNYNIDRNTLEAFPDTLTQLRAAHSVFTSMGYIPRWYKSATSKLKVIYNGGIGEDTASASSGESTSVSAKLPKFTAVQDSGGEVVYTLLEDMDITPGTPEQAELYAIEGTINDFEVNGDTCITTDYLDSKNRLYFIQPNVAQNGIFICDTESFEGFTIEELDSLADSGCWKRVTNLYQQLPGSKVFQFGIDPSTGSSYIQFPEDIGSLIGSGLYIKYILSNGSYGNVAAKTLTEFPSLSITASNDDSSVVLPTDVNFSVTNISAITNGKDPETIAEMQDSYQRVVGTFDTLVTLRDYESYLYNQEDTLGQPLVSNIRVSDRTNDLYSSCVVKGLDIQGQATSEVVNLDNDFTAYDLRFYPVGNSASSITKNNFNSTFKTYGDSTAETSSAMRTKLINEVGEAKAIIHDYKEWMGQPIYLNYELRGQIYLQKTVSEDEADSIKEAVIQNLCTHLNARELEFGQAIDYGSVVNWIKESDPRIQYVALEPIDYVVDEDSLKAFDSRNNGLDVYQRSVLNGNTPWTTYDSLPYYWNTDVEKTVEGVNENGNPLKSISPQVVGKFDSTSETYEAPWSGGSYEVRANETLAIIVPEYTVTTTYSNYFYAVYVGDEEIPADTPYQLKGNQRIYIYEERPEDSECADPNEKNATYTLKNVVIKSSVKLGEGKYAKNKRINMGYSITISVVERDESEIISTYANTTEQYKAGIRIITNSQALIDAMSGSNSKSNKASSEGVYTLNIGESLIWTNNVSPIVEIGTISEGNTIVWKEGTPVPNLIADEYDDFSELTWVNCGNDKLSYRANSIYNFGAGYTISFKNKDGELVTDSTSYNPTKVSVLPSTVTAIAYEKKDGSSEGTLPALLKGDQYGVTALLSVAIGPGSTQELSSGQQIVLTYEDNKEILQPSNSDEIYTYLNSNSLIVCSGGLPTTVSEEAAKSLKLQTLTSKSEPALLQSFESIIGTDGYKVPGNSSDIFVVPVVTAQNIVGYLLVKGGVSLSSTTALKIGQLYKVVDNAKCYVKTKESFQYLEVASLLGTNNIRQLGVDHLYDGRYNPLYTPKTQEYIKDPEKAVNYFNAAHVCNRYVLPKLVSWDNLKISSLSIREN